MRSFVPSRIVVNDPSLVKPSTVASSPAPGGAAFTAPATWTSRVGTCASRVLAPAMATMSSTSASVMLRSSEVEPIEVSKRAAGWITYTGYRCELHHTTPSGADSRQRLGRDLVTRRGGPPVPQPRLLQVGLDATTRLVRLAQP